MLDLKEQLKIEARRHSTKLFKKIEELPEVSFPSIVMDAIRQEILYATMDGYRATMKHNRNGEHHEEEQEGNY